jgi:ABC-type bacteriocin/lantibiotic exporter with double-glycine peptidase domain
MKNQINYIKDFFFIIKKELSKVPFIIFFFIFNSVIDLLSIALLVPFIGHILFPENNNFNIINIFFPKIFFDSTVYILGIILITLFFLKMIISTFVHYYITKFTLSFQISTMKRMLINLQQMPYNKYIKKSNSDYLEVIFNLTSTFSTQVLMPVLKILSSFFIIIFLSILMLNFSYKIFLFLVFIVIVVSLFYYKFSKINSFFGRQSSVANQNLLQTFQESIDGYKEILIYGKEIFFKNKIDFYSKKYLKNEIHASIISFLPKYILEFFVVFFIVCYFFYLNYEKSSKLDQVLPILFVYVASIIRILPSLNTLLVSMANINYGKYSIFKLKNNLIFSSRKKRMNNKNIIFSFDKISFNNLYFGYNKKNIIKNLNFTIEKNDIVGIFGESGSGKTTFINIFLGLYKESSGKISINDNYELSRVINFWQSIIAYMPQDNFLINDTIKKNITFENHNTKDFYEVLKYSRLNKLIANQKKNIHALISDKGRNISGGQKQRISFARALYHDREILILDEATSSLDEKTINEIYKFLKIIKKNKTVLIVTHNKKLLKLCNKLLRFGS